MSRIVLSRDQLAEALGVSPVLLELWKVRGCPTVEAGAPTREGHRDMWWQVTRGELATEWGCHVDTISHWLRLGLEGAVVVPGGAGKETLFDYRLALRWKLNREHPRFLSEIHEESRQLSEALDAVLQDGAVASPSPEASGNGVPPAPSRRARRRESSA